MYRVIYDSTDANSFVVHKETGDNRYFEESTTGLYFWDTCDSSSHLLVNTIADKKTRYTARAYQGAVTARKLQNVLGRPSTHTYLNIVDKNLLPNCPVTRADIFAAEDICCPNLGSLKGKLVRKTTDHVRPGYKRFPGRLWNSTRTLLLPGTSYLSTQLPSQCPSLGTSNSVPER
jgi:hypothetical protein